MPLFARRGDFWSGLVLAALGSYVLLQARQWVYMGEDGPGAGFFPVWYGGAMIVLSLVLVARTILFAESGGPAKRIEWHELGRALVCWVAFVACIALMPYLGFTVAFALLTWFMVAVLARQPQRIAIPLAVAQAAVFYVLFTVALDLSLPKGFLF